MNAPISNKKGNATDREEKKPAKKQGPFGRLLSWIAKGSEDMTKKGSGCCS